MDATDCSFESFLTEVHFVGGLSSAHFFPSYATLPQSLSITTYRNAEAMRQKDKNHPFQLFKKIIRDFNVERTG